jgi:hypothetical protein
MATGPGGPHIPGFRESLDKQDKRDVAQSLFARDPDGRFLPAIRTIRNLTLEREGDDAKAVAANEANLRLLQRNALDELYEADEIEFTELDRPVLNT